MNTSFVKSSVASAIAACLLAGCTTPSGNQNAETRSPYTAEELIARNEALLARESELARKEAQLREAQLMASTNTNAVNTSGAPMSPVDGGNDLLPPNGKAGECYARVWVEPQYKTIEETLLSKEASSRIEIIPAKYEMAEETVLVSQASSRLETIPATYETLTEQKLVSAGGLSWKLDLGNNAAPASEELLNTASHYGVNLNAATPGTCFHEHFVAAKFEDVQDQVLTKEAYDVISVKDAEYQWVEKQVLVSEASSRLEEIPAVYQTVKEKVIDVPAHTIWKKGTGPIQRLNEATGEIMCLVDVPATYKTVTREVLASPATTREIAIPAQYEMVKVKQLVNPTSQMSTNVPAEYKYVTVTKKIADPTFVWHDVHDLSMSKASRTGNQICLTEQPPKYETVTSTVVKTPAQTTEIEIPAEYTVMQVRKLVTAAQQNVIEIPAEYETVKLRQVDHEGFMEWRSILCETNMNTETITGIQQALKDRGYNPGVVDGIIGRDTMNAVNKFQTDNSLPVDTYLNMDTIKALRVSI